MLDAYHPLALCAGPFTTQNKCAITLRGSSGRHGGSGPVLPPNIDCTPA